MVSIRIKSLKNETLHFFVNFWIKNTNQRNFKEAFKKQKDTSLVKAKVWKKLFSKLNAENKF